MFWVPRVILVGGGTGGVRQGWRERLSLQRRCPLGVLNTALCRSQILRPRVQKGWRGWHFVTLALPGVRMGLLRKTRIIVLLHRSWIEMQQMRHLAGRSWALCSCCYSLGTRCTPEKRSCFAEKRENSSLTVRTLRDHAALIGGRKRDCVGNSSLWSPVLYLPSIPFKLFFFFKLYIILLVTLQGKRGGVVFFFF